MITVKGLKKSKQGFLTVEIENKEWDCGCDVNFHGYDLGIILLEDENGDRYAGIPVDEGVYEAAYPFDENGGI